MKKSLKFITFCVGIVLFLLFCIYKFQEYKFNQNLNSENLNFFINEIRTSKNLPENFYKTYEKINPNSLRNNLIFSVLNNTQCQSKRVARRIYPIVKKHNNKRIDNLTFEYFLTLEIEKKTTQKQCLNWNSQKSDFLNGVKGIEKASNYYFKEKLQNLNEKQIETIIKMLENPSKYNPQ